MLIDSHCHLDRLNLAAYNGDLSIPLREAREQGVGTILCVSTDMARLPDMMALLSAHADVLGSVGVHPMSDEIADITTDQLVTAAADDRVVAIGETGLDYHYTAESAEIQKTSLKVHIEAAQETGLPLIIHARAADDDMAQILTDGFKTKPYTCVMHCFSSSAELARAALDLGFYLSMSGIAAFPKSQELRDIFAAAPVDRVLVETDSPYLAPPPHRGKRNEPAYTAHTARVGAELFGMDYADFARQTQENFDRLFWKAAQYEAAA